jgi:CRISPR-associated protein Cmr2
LSAEELDGLGLQAERPIPMNAHFSYSNAPEEWSRALFAYLFFAFKKRLRGANTGGLGALWDFMPADTRMPDHAIWHHCGLSSALASSMADDPHGRVSLAVFSITPVQAFIAKARKLRDHWVGSVLLSYMAFAGLRHLAKSLGPDHVMYPSLHDQPLVEMWLDREYHLGHFLTEPNEHVRGHNEESKGIASFPNKFVFAAATADVEEICRGVQQAIQDEWLRIAGLVRDFLAPKLGAGTVLRGLFDHQVADYWRFSFAAIRLLEIGDAQELGTLLHESKWQEECRTVQAFAAPFGENGKRLARMYASTHNAVQSLLAAAKLKPQGLRNAQHGEKCPLCGEHEVLHDFQQAGRSGAGEYKDAVKAFWEEMRRRMNSEGSYAQVGENERLCAVCSIKRFLPQVLQRHRDELLFEVLRKDAEKFPSTTEIAAHDYLQKLKSLGEISEKDIGDLLNMLHDDELKAGDDETSESVRRIVAMGRSKNIFFAIRDKYYAVLMMDGDKMGDLINGATIEAKWSDVIHPKLREKFSHADFAPKSPLRTRMEQKRTLNPALHAAISESLNGFARYGAAPAVRRGFGRLIYAGGDDLCAIMPLGTVLETADAVRRAYSMGFVRYSADGVVPLSGTLTDFSGKMGMHLGRADGISISGAIVIAHHKTPLREVIRDAHILLEGTAKEEAGRNALAVRLSKRSGGDRDLVFKWDEKNYFMDNEELLSASFQSLMQDVMDDELASRLIYRLSDLQDAVAPMARTLNDRSANREKIVRLFAYEVGHSGKMIAAQDSKEMKQKIELMAARLAGICIRKPSDKPGWFNPDAAVVARFLAPSSIRRK